MDRGPHLLENYANAKTQRVKVDEPFVPALKKKEAAEVEHSLAEPKSDNVPVDGVFGFNKENSGKCLGLEDFSCGFEYGFRTNYGGLDLYNIQGEDDLKLEVLDGLLDDVDEVDDIHAANALSTACGDFLLDIEFAEIFSALDNHPTEGKRLGNSSSESHSPGFSGNSNVAVGISDSSTVTVPESECKIDSIDKTVTSELHENFRSKCEYQVPIEDKKCHSSTDVQKFDELDSKNSPNSPDVQKFDKLDSKNFPNSHDEQKFDQLDSNKCPSSPNVHKFDDSDNDGNLLLSSLLSKCKKRKKSSILGTRVKRLRRPTQRYIEEFSNLKSVYHMGGQKESTAALEKRPKDKALSQSWLRQGRVKKAAPVLESESSDEYSASESDDYRVRKKKPKVSVDRRKHQRMWTLSEVMKLVDGISQFGIGKWTAIKRLLFPSSTHRTPIDLRDKWRNLIRSSFAQKQNEREVEQKHIARALPKDVITRICELATIHPYPSVPYPRVRNSEISSCNDHVASSELPTETESAPYNTRKKWS
ncbi:hypothetical protein Q3G72_003999 [Acer saccharum]|nr:hypothetical protein Q3G72_003999 [Acer saccharum]